VDVDWHLLTWYTRYIKVTRIVRYCQVLF
jgi:hypothetical protein